MRKPLSSTVDEVVLVALGDEVMMRNRKKKQKEMQRSVYVQLLAKAFPVLLCAFRLWLCVWGWMLCIVCAQVQLQESFCP